MKTEKFIKYVFFILLQISLIVVTQGQTSFFYGTTYDGGSNNRGVIFKTDNNGENYTVVYDFIENNDSRPCYGKMCNINGILYGTAESGVLFSYNTLTETYTKLHDFDGENTGESPKSNPILALNGKLYGTTIAGGLYNGGTLYEYDIESGIFTKKLDFEDDSMGRQLFANVMQASNGKLYGVTNKGGLYDAGVLYEYDYTNEVFTKLIDFDGNGIGRGPIALLEVESNLFYGICQSGGPSGGGTIFEYAATTNSVTLKFDFTSFPNTGWSPVFSFMQASNGKLYGVTRSGTGTNGVGGVLYEYDINTEMYTVKQDFSSETGDFSSSTLLEASNGYLYGLTGKGGLNNKGTLLEYHLDTNSLIKKFDFAIATGSSPRGDLIEVDESNLGNSEFVEQNQGVTLWPNPVNDLLNVKDNKGIPFSMRIYNLLGQELEFNSDFKLNHEITVSDLNTGIYNLTVFYQNGITQSIKFIKN